MRGNSSGLYVRSDGAGVDDRVARPSLRGCANRPSVTMVRQLRLPVYLLRKVLMFTTDRDGYVYEGAFTAF